MLGKGELMIGLAILFLPLVFSAAILFSSRCRESVVARIALLFSWIGLANYIFLIVGRVFGWIPRIVDLRNLFRIHDESFDLVFLFDEKSLVFLGLSTFLYWIIVRFSRVYLHREPGFGRFFRTLFLSQFGIALLASAGNMEVLSIGWEIVGLSSFLLICFYRDRATPILNAMRIYGVYRICDAGLLLATFMVNTLYNEEHHFLSFDPSLIKEGIMSHPQLSFICGVAILLPALGKSAQFPFSFWLPRALEGPTPSTAVFYGALSIHAGVFLLLRTQTLWFQDGFVRGMVLVSGLVSLLVGTLAGRAQSNIKGQIGYASIAQVGAMMMEVALGFDHLVLLHMVSHAVLRTYQFLSSPSVVAHFIRQPVKDHRELLFQWMNQSWVRRLSIGEFFLEEFFEEKVMDPIRSLGKSGFLLFWVLVLGIFTIYQMDHQRLFTQALFLSLVFALRGISTRDQRGSMGWVAASWIAILATVGSFYDAQSIVLLCSMGFFPGLALWFIGKVEIRYLGWLLMAGFPISPLFFGQDLLLSKISQEGLLPVLLFLIVFVLNGIVMVRAFVETTWLRGARPLE